MSIVLKETTVKTSAILTTAALKYIYVTSATSKWLLVLRFHYFLKQLLARQMMGSFRNGVPKPKQRCTPIAFLFIHFAFFRTFGVSYFQGNLRAFRVADVCLLQRNTVHALFLKYLHTPCCILIKRYDGLNVF